MSVRSERHMRHKCKLITHTWLNKRSQSRTRSHMRSLKSETARTTRSVSLLNLLNPAPVKLKHHALDPRESTIRRVELSDLLGCLSTPRF